MQKTLSTEPTADQGRLNLHSVYIPIALVPHVQSVRVAVYGSCYMYNKPVYSVRLIETA